MSSKKWLIVLAVSAVASWALSPLCPPLVLVVPALLIALAIPTLARWNQLARRSPNNEQRAFEYILVGIGLALGARLLFVDVLNGSKPFNTGDHQIMMARAEEFAEALYRGEWLRWTHLAQGGDSTTDTYPFLANVITAIIHLVYPEGTRFEHSYSVFVVFSWWLRGFGAYFLCRRFAGPSVSLLIAVAAVFETGRDVWDGVWHGVLFFGMAHSGFALSLALFPTAIQVDCLREKTTGRLIALTLAVLITAFAHPLGLTYTALALVSLIGAAFLAPFDWNKLGWTLAAMATGLALASFWTLPFAYTLSQMSYSNAVGGVSSAELGKGMIDGSTPTTSFPGWAGFVVVALVASLLSRNLPVVAAAVLSIILWLLPVENLMSEVRIFSLMPGLLEGQLRRMFTVLKSASLPCIAWLLWSIVTRFQLPMTLRPKHVFARAVIVTVLLLGPARALGGGFDHLVESLQEQLQGSASRRPYTNESYDRVFGAVAERRRSDPSPTPWRVAIDWTRNWRHAAWIEGWRIGVPVVDFVTTPANFLTYRPRELEAQALAEWNVRYFITERDQAPFPGATLVLKTSPYVLWENPAYDDRFVVAPEGVKISNLRIAGNTIEFDVAGAPASGVDVRIRCAWYTRWRGEGAASDVRATLPRPGAKPKQDQLLVRVTNGRASLHCDGPPPRGRLGWFLSLVGALCFGFVASPKLRRHTEEKVLSAIARGRSALHALYALDARKLRLLKYGGASAGLLLAVFIAFFWGSRTFLVPPLANPLLTVAAITDDSYQRCTARWWNPDYRCARSSVVVRPAVGASPRGDDTHEYHRLWAGTRVQIASEGTTAELTYRRTHLPDSQLTIEYQTHGGFDVELLIDGTRVGKKTFDGTGQHVFALPEDTSRVATLQLRVTARIRGGWLTFHRR